MIPLVGMASGVGGADEGSCQGPLLLQKRFEANVEWSKIFHSHSVSADLTKEQRISLLNHALAEEVCQVMERSPFTMVIGGDHSCGIGTWSGAAEALRRSGKELALLWLDAHMDAHTPETSPSGNIHGMPLATLLGYGASPLTRILSLKAKVKPENIFPIGIRSYEKEERELLEKLNVRIYYMEEVRKRGLKVIFSEIMEKLVAKKLAYGISLDIDFFCSKMMSATATPEINGAYPQEFIENFPIFAAYPPVLFEYVEFNPPRDNKNQSLKWSLDILQNVIQHAQKHNWMKKEIFKSGR